MNAFGEVEKTAVHQEPVGSADPTGSIAFERQERSECNNELGEKDPLLDYRLNERRPPAWGVLGECRN